MKKIIIWFFLMFCFTFSFAQTASNNVYWGTIRVKKIRSDKDLIKRMRKKKPGIRMFWGRYNGNDYKETFPIAYQSRLLPLIFNRGGFILTDENKQWSDNIITGFDYEVFIGNTAALKVNSANYQNINDCLRSLHRGEYIWITGLYYVDPKGVIHRNEIGDFKVERMN